MKTWSWVFLALFLGSGLVFVWQNNSVTGHMVAQDTLTLCKNTLDCSSGKQCCVFANSDGGFCGDPSVCQVVTSVTYTEKELKAVLETTNSLAFFLPMNGAIIGIMVTSLLGLVFSLRKS